MIEVKPAHVDEARTPTSVIYTITGTFGAVNDEIRRLFREYEPHAYSLVTISMHPRAIGSNEHIAVLSRAASCE